MINIKSISLLFLSISILILGLSSCSAINTAVKKKDLDVQTKMSETIFLDPVAPKDKIIYVDIKNTSSEEINIIKDIENVLKNRGYKLTDNPNKARYMLQGNILKIGKSDLRESNEYLDSGFGSKAVDIAAGVGTAYALGKSSKDTVAIGLAGLALGFVGDAMVKDVMYIMVTDLQIRERPSYGEVVVQTKESNLAQGSSTTVQQYVESAEVQWKTYHTRIVSTANKVNLEFQDAKPLLEVELSRSISGIF